MKLGWDSSIFYSQRSNVSYASATGWPNSDRSCKACCNSSLCFLAVSKHFFILLITMLATLLVTLSCPPEKGLVMSITSTNHGEQKLIIHHNNYTALKFCFLLGLMEGTISFKTVLELVKQHTSVLIGTADISHSCVDSLIMKKVLASN